MKFLGVVIMGRNAMPIDILTAKGKKHLTKQEIQDRKESELKLGLQDFKQLTAPVFVKNDVVAFKYWKKLVKEYKDAAASGMEVLSTTDIGSLALYCKTYSEYEGLLKIRQRLDRISDSAELEDALMDKAVDLERIVQKTISELLSVEGVLKLETAINKKMDMLIKMQDRLFLNPLAKVKNVPKKEKQKPKNPMEAAGFNL